MSFGAGAVLVIGILMTAAMVTISVLFCTCRKKERNNGMRTQRRNSAVVVVSGTSIQMPRVVPHRDPYDQAVPSYESLIHTVTLPTRQLPQTRRSYLQYGAATPPVLSGRLSRYDEREALVHTRQEQYQEYMATPPDSEDAPPAYESVMCQTTIV